MWINRDVEMSAHCYNSVCTVFTNAARDFKLTSNLSMAV
jgi:hypothetical protein